MKSRVRTRTGTENIEAFDIKHLTYPPVRFMKKWKNKKVIEYADDFAVFDSETSHNHDLEHPIGWVYQWAFLFKGRYVYGRRPSEFIDLLQRLRAHYELGADRKIIVYVHNLAYDGQYLKHYLKEYAGNALRIMATDNHSYLYIDVPGFRIYCSYRLTNLSLDSLSKDYSKTYLKAAGAIDYNIIRYQTDRLTETDWYYMFSDVASQHDAIRQYLDAQGYLNAFDAPITSTGFVRVDCRRESEKVRSWRDTFTGTALTTEQFNLARACFMGGVTICSYEFSAVTVRGDLGHRDFTSSYPAQQMVKYFPTGKFVPYGDVDSREELEYLLDNYCCMFLLTMENVTIKPGVTAPFIPSSKCMELFNPLRLNGKVVKADRLTIAVTEIDYRIYKEQYNAQNVFIHNMNIATRGPLPAWLKSKIMQYFRAKCELKKSDPLLYMASKAKLNGIYGMSATSPVRPDYEVDDDLIMQPKQVDAEKELAKFYRSYNSFLPYQWGVWTTAHARRALYDMIVAVGYDRFLYCDTDSVFYMKSAETERRLEEMNDRIRRASQAAGAVVGNNILGLATEEPELTAFRGLHAKCYATIEEGQLKVTIAGIPKRATKWQDGQPVTRTNAEELGDIDNLNDGFIFHHCGGTRAVYVEDVPHRGRVNGHRTEYASSVIIEGVEKEISDTMYTVGADYTLLDPKIRYF